MKNLITIMLTSGSYHAHCPISQLGFYSPSEIEFVRFDDEQYLTRDEITDLCSYYSQQKEDEPDEQRIL